MPYVSAVKSQKDGSKSACIAELIRQGGFDRKHVLMIGDAPGDMQAAIDNGAVFFPIVPGAESESWRLLAHKAWDSFVNGDYHLIDKHKDCFVRHLGL